MRAMIAGSCLLLGAVTAVDAQCLGDFNNDGKVLVNELVISVNNALNDCGGVQPQNRCPFAFTADVSGGTQGLCLFDGPFNTVACADNVLASGWVGDGANLVIALDTNPVAAFAANVTGPNSADLLFWSVDQFDTATPVSGSVTMEDSGTRLVIAPAAPPFMIDNCSFRRYVGTFSEVATRGGTKKTAASGADMNHLLVRAQAWAANAVAPALPNIEHRQP